MANIISYPDTLSLVSNLKKFEATSVIDVRFKLYQGAKLLVDESFSPGTEGKVVVDVSEIVKNELNLFIPTTDVFQQTEIIKEFTAHIDGTIKTFKAIRSGVENLATSPLIFLTGNFLTWQPQTKSVSHSQPEWLTYFAPVSGNLKVKFYLKNGESSIKILAAIAADSCVSVNVNFARIMGLEASEKYGYYDIWFESTAGERLTYEQRYLYREPESSDEYFLLENSLGGLDTAVMSGESVFSPELEHTEGQYNEESEQLDGAISRLYQKGTGWKAKGEADWLWDFFRATKKYKVHEGVIRKITLKESTVVDSSHEDMKSYMFTYRLASDKGLLNISRSTDPLPTNIEITTPAGLFFLAPRLNDLPDFSEDIGLIPIQSPYLQQWYKLNLGFLKRSILDSVSSAGGPYNDYVQKLMQVLIVDEVNNTLFSTKTFYSMGKVYGLGLGTDEGASFISFVVNDNMELEMSIPEQHTGYSFTIEDGNLIYNIQ